MALSKKLLLRRWVHSHEEDTAAETVYRPGDFTFPPSRGRESFTLKAGGAYLHSAPGPTDASASSEGKWQLDDDVVNVVSPTGARLRSFRVTALSPDRLVVKKS